MTVELSHFLVAQQAFTKRVHAVHEDQWHAPTPDSEWDVEKLVRHMIEEHRYAAPLLHGQDLDSARKVVEGSRTYPVDGGVGANVAQEWDEAAVESADAFSADGALDRTVALSRGDTAVRDYLAEMTFDLVVHGWDLAQAIGFTEPFPAEAVEAVYGIVQGFGDLASSGLFDPPVPVPDDATTIDKLVALTGRKPG